jgi:phosphatidate cytidylyltransferase
MSKKYVNEDIDSREREEKTQTEFASATCFSSEQENKYKKTKSNFLSNTINKVTGVIPKILMPPQAPVDETKGKWADLVQRAKWTIYMLIGFVFFILLGNFYCACLVLLVIMAIYNELLDLAKYKDRNTEVKNYYLISWYFFFLCIYYFYIKLLMDKVNYLAVYPIFNYILKYHNLISFMLYIIGFFLFINSLTKGYYRYQFRSFAWIHIVLFIFGISSSMIMANIFNGLVW